MRSLFFAWRPAPSFLFCPLAVLFNGSSLSLENES